MKLVYFLTQTPHKNGIAACSKLCRLLSFVCQRQNYCPVQHVHFID